jgi:hypothetical protein
LGATAATTASVAEAVSTCGARGAAKRDADSTRGGAVGKTKRGTREGWVEATVVASLRWPWSELKPELELKLQPEPAWAPTQVVGWRPVPCCAGATAVTGADTENGLDP